MVEQSPEEWQVRVEVVVMELRGLIKAAAVGLARSGVVAYQRVPDQALDPMV